MSISGWMDKENVLCMHTIEYYAAKGKKKSKYCHCYNMDGPQGHYAK